MEVFVESLDCDNGDAMELTISIMPEQMERFQHFADLARVSLARFLREGGEVLAAQMADNSPKAAVEHEVATQTRH